MTDTSKYSVTHDSSGRIIIREKPESSPAVTVVIPWKIIAAALLALTLFVNRLFPSDTENTVAVFNNGFVFEDSNVRILTDADLMSIYEMQTSEYDAKIILRLAINEIYARHNYKFTEAEFAEFYSQYSWYNGYLSAEEACSQFNNVENQNLSFLIMAEKNNYFDNL